MTEFDHDRLQVYHVSISFVALVNGLVDKFPPGRSYLGDQLHRASTSIVLNIAEGAGEFSKKERLAFIAWHYGRLPNVPAYWMS
jgi:four helix bundle protein